MNFAIKNSLGILLVVVLVYAESDFTKQCQALRCNSSTEICRINPKCERDGLLKCVYCILKNDSNQKVASSIFQQPLASRLLARSGGEPVSNDSSPSSYDEYYEYDEDETSDKNGFGEEDDYLDEYVDPIDTVINRSEPIRKLGICPKVVEAVGKCDSEKIIQPECRFDTDCPGELKCCEAACGRRVCNVPIKATIASCPKTFQCTLNCRLGYRTDPNGCLKCECQSCPSMDQCNKNCASGYLKDLFGCDICECSDQCPPFSCNIRCPPNVGFAQANNGCPLCQCAAVKSKPIEKTSSCQEDIYCPPGFRCLNDARNVPMCQAVPIVTESCPNDLATTCNLQCPNGNYLLDGIGCPTCACASDIPIDQPSLPCPLIKCRADCGNAGYALDENGCQTCHCKVNIPCPRTKCRMFCQYGFRRDNNGCEVCECDWSPVIESIQCSERIPCTGTRVCNLELKVCEIVDPDRVNWFVYDFEVQTSLFDDPKFVEIFKSGLVNNIAHKYGLKTTQITVSSVERNGITSFQIMPYYAEKMDVFEKKMDQIDVALSSHEFRAVLPAVARAVENGDIKTPNGLEKGTSTGGLRTRLYKTWTTSGSKPYIIAIVFTSIAVIFAIVVSAIYLCRRHGIFQKRSESKSPIYETSYHQAPSDEDHYHAIHAPDGTAYVVVQSDDMHSSHDKRALV